MTYKKTTAAERRQEVKLRYLHVSPKGAIPAMRAALKRVVQMLTPARIPEAPLGLMNPGNGGRESTMGAFGTGKPAGTKLRKRF